MTNYYSPSARTGTAEASSESLRATLGGRLGCTRRRVSWRLTLYICRKIHGWRGGGGGGGRGGGGHLLERHTTCPSSSRAAGQSSIKMHSGIMPISLRGNRARRWFNRQAEARPKLLYPLWLRTPQVPFEEVPAMFMTKARAGRRLWSRM